MCSNNDYLPERQVINIHMTCVMQWRVACSAFSITSYSTRPSSARQPAVVEAVDDDCWNPDQAVCRRGTMPAAQPATVALPLTSLCSKSPESLFLVDYSCIDLTESFTVVRPTACDKSSGSDWRS